MSLRSTKSDQQQKKETDLESPISTQQYDDILDSEVVVAQLYEKRCKQVGNVYV